MAHGTWSPSEDIVDPTDDLVSVADAVRLRVRHWPGRTDPPFLLVHGLSSNALLWDAVAARLAAAGYGSYAVDLRSHGESDSPAQGYDTQTAGADLARVCAELIGRPVVAVGQSWGGNVVIRLAARWPELVCAVGLVDGGWIALAEEFGSWEECAAALTPPEVSNLRAADLRGWLRRDHPDWSDAAIEATIANLRERADGTLERRLPIPLHMEIVRSMWDDPPWSDLGGIKVSTLLLPAIASDADRARARRASVQRAAELLARSRIREYVGADHDLHAQHPDQVAADLLSLVAQG